MSKDAEALLRFFYDNVWASIRYVHHQGYANEIRELIDASLVEEYEDIYVLASQKKTDLAKHA